MASVSAFPRAGQLPLNIARRKDGNRPYTRQPRTPPVGLAYNSLPTLPASGVKVPMRRLLPYCASNLAQQAMGSRSLRYSLLREIPQSPGGQHLVVAGIDQRVPQYLAFGPGAGF